MFPGPQTRIGTVVIPPGKRALSLEVTSLPGVSGFAGAGDHIDIYRVAKADGVPPGVQLILQGVEVLNVNGGGLASAQGQPAGPNLVFLLAVTPADAERLIYLSEFEKMYFDLASKGEPAVTTPGAGPGPGLAAT
jgi:Flp pilus assembly protein CpaB